MSNYFLQLVHKGAFPWSKSLNSITIQGHVNPYGVKNTPFFGKINQINYKF